MKKTLKDAVGVQQQTAVIKEPVKVEVAPLSMLEQRENDFEVKDRVYKLTGAFARSPWLKLQCDDRPSSSDSNDRLLYFDEEKRQQRSLRYAINQKSIFLDEQGGVVVQEPVVFKDKGILMVDRKNRSLQMLLSLYHPWNADIPGGRAVFVELKPGEEAKKVVDEIINEVETLKKAIGMNLEETEAVLRPIHGPGVVTMSTEELERNLLVFAKQDPKEFLLAFENDDLLLINKAYKSIDTGVCIFADAKRTYKFSTGKIITKLPYGEDPYEEIAKFFKTDEGLEVQSIIESKLKKQ